MAGKRKAPAKTTAKKQEPTLEWRDGYWWFGKENLGRNKRYAEQLLAERQ
jgi:hypothetical protein